MNINKPIFIIGSGRSGTTILYKLLSTHPNVCWFSNYINIFPKCSYINIFNRTLDVPFLGPRFKKSIMGRKTWAIIPRPVEADYLYHKYCRFEELKKTTEENFSLELENKFKNIIKNLLVYTKKSRFLSKQTANTQRIRLINKMFPDAYYIHIIRDGRAVANSLINVSWWEDMNIWWLGYSPRKWEEMGKDPIKLCGLHWKHNLEEILKNKYLFEDRYIELRYEELIQNTRNTLYRITDFCKLSWPDNYKKIIPKKLFNMNYKWKKQLTKKQIEVLNETLSKELNNLGYN